MAIYMTDPIHDFYRKANLPFHKVIPLHEIREKSFDELSQMVPLLPRGWYELNRVSKEDRLEFTRDYWLSKLPFSMTKGSELEERILSFFEGIDDIALFATQMRENSPFEPHMVYSLIDDSSFFHGLPPADSQAIESLSSQFANFSFPSDFLAFLEIHDGFSKFTDNGLIRIRDMSRVYLRFQQMLSTQGILTVENQIVDPKHLIPFYESFGIHSYQCFFAESLPTLDVSNIHYSEFERGFGSFVEERSLDENLSFSSFLAWLCFYLEDVGYSD